MTIERKRLKHKTSNPEWFCFDRFGELERERRLLGVKLDLRNLNDDCFAVELKGSLESALKRRDQLGKKFV